MKSAYFIPLYAIFQAMKVFVGFKGKYCSFKTNEDSL